MTERRRGLKKYRTRISACRSQALAAYGIGMGKIMRAYEGMEEKHSIGTTRNNMTPRPLSVSHSRNLTADESNGSGSRSDEAVPCGGAAIAVDLTLDDEKPRYPEDPYVPSALVGVMTQNSLRQLDRIKSCFYLPTHTSHPK